MKRLLTLPLLLILLLLSNCARFNTTQTDVSYGTNGEPQRTITTKATAWTFISSSSELSKFKASQTDKTQSATVGSLSQSSEISTNLNDMIGTIIGAAVKAAATSAKP